MNSKYMEAKCNFNTIEFAHIPLEAGFSKKLVSDPWSFMRIYIQSKLAKGSPKHVYYTRAIYFLNLAESFYKAAEKAAKPAKYTLHYYGMLNLVKSLLSMNYIELERVYESHGLSVDPKRPRELQFKRSKDNILSVFAEFSKILDREIDVDFTLSLEKILRGIPELHNTFKATNSDKEFFLPLKITFETDKKNHKKLRYKIEYEKKYNSIVRNDILTNISKKSSLSEIQETNGITTYLSKTSTVKSLNNPKIRPYKKFISEISSLQISSILTTEGYRYYATSPKIKHKHLTLSYSLLFYLGSIARYQPRVLEDFTSTGSPLSHAISEAMELCPSQLLYHLCSLMTESICILPKAKI